MILKHLDCIRKKNKFCLCLNKHAGQLHVNRTADQRLLFRYTNSEIPEHPKSDYLIQASIAVFFAYSAWFVFYQVGNHEDRISHDGALCYEILRP